MKIGLYKNLANAIRFLSADAVQKANSGHPGMPLGMADVATVLFKNHIKFCAKDPHWRKRDRFVLSCGHGCMLLYSLLYLTGYPGIKIEDIKNFRQINSPCAGHPEYGLIPGIETTTGPLGQGLGNAVGMAIAEKHLDIGHHVYVMASDGDLMEGISHETFSLAGHLNLNRLVVLYDSNKITIDGAIDLSCSDNVVKRFESYGFYVQEIDGHNYDMIDGALSDAKKSDRPNIIICNTTIGHGAPGKEGSEKAHGAPLGADVIRDMRESLGWQYPPFFIPDEILNAWREIGLQYEKEYEQSKSGFVYDFDSKLDLKNYTVHSEPQKQNYKFDLQDIPNMPKVGAQIATRKASGIVLEFLSKKFANIIGGSADLTPSNDTKTSLMSDFSKNNPKGRYIHFGIREHAMGAIVNGISLHGELRPYCGTFLIFTDYMRPAIRLAAIMGLPNIYVMTHDSIGLGEDGATHQPIEHFASFRAMPEIYIFRPCDATETAECWQLALGFRDNPSILALSRQDLNVQRELSNENKACKGAYIVEENSSDPEFVLIASGSEVELALEVARGLSNRTYKVISMPCYKLFFEQDEIYKEKLLYGKRRIGIEAGSRMGFSDILRPDDLFFGMHTFGASAPYKDLYEYFGLTKEKILNEIKIMQFK